jgi:hypothetical protein
MDTDIVSEAIGPDGGTFRRGGRPLGDLDSLRNACLFLFHLVYLHGKQLVIGNTA